MRNFKKLIAMGTALAMAIIMNVSAFAAAGDTAEEPITDAYANGAVVVSAIKAALPTMTEGAQYTVVVVPVGEEISDSNIHYINQADRNDPIWQDGTTWGTPDTLEDDDYVVRIGNEAGQVKEIYFRVGSTQPPVQQGPKVTFMNGATTVATVDTVDGKATLPTEVPTLAKVDGYATSTYTFVEWVTVATVDGKEVLTPFTADTVVEADTTVYPKFKSNLIYGDVTGDGKVLGGDKTYITLYINTGRKVQQTAKQISEHLGANVIAGDVTGDGKVLGGDKTYITLYINTGRKVQKTAQEYYIVNK